MTITLDGEPIKSEIRDLKSAIEDNCYLVIICDTFGSLLY